MKILIVDDSKFIRKVLKSMLNDMGFINVSEAGNGLEAIRKMHIVNPEIVFLNLIMPEMDGYEASKEILKTFSDTKIVIVSANEYEDSPFNGSDIKIHDYISLPFNKNKIENILNCVKQ